MATAAKLIIPTTHGKKKGTVYRGAEEEKRLLFSRVWAMPNAWTFKIGPIAKLLERYVPAGGRGWIDPYAGYNSPAEGRNDLDPKAKAEYHLDALEFAKAMKDVANMYGKFDGILYDPPYSFRQISEHYKALGLKATQKDTSMAFYEKAKSAFCELIKPGGYAISFGWNSNGFGKARGFEIVEIMLVAHGGSKNDTIVVVERKL